MAWKGWDWVVAWDGFTGAVDTLTYLSCTNDGVGGPFYMDSINLVPDGSNMVSHDSVHATASCQNCWGTSVYSDAFWVLADDYIAINSNQKAVTFQSETFTQAGPECTILGTGLILNCPNVFQHMPVTEQQTERECNVSKALGMSANGANVISTDQAYASQDVHTIGRGDFQLSVLNVDTNTPMVNGPLMGTESNNPPNSLLLVTRNVSVTYSSGDYLVGAAAIVLTLDDNSTCKSSASRGIFI